MTPYGPFRPYTLLMSKCLLKAQCNGNVSSEPPLLVFVDLTNPIWLSVHEGLLLQSSQQLCSQICLGWVDISPKLLKFAGSNRKLPGVGGCWGECGT